MEQLIGNTPLVQIRSLSKATGANIYAKLELCNPAGSAKDRVALNIIRAAEERGELIRGEPGWVFEGTSGSTGISIAMVCNALGYRAHISLPDDTSLEKLALLESLGATVNKVKPASIVDTNQYVNAAKKACDDLSKEGNGVRSVLLTNLKMSQLRSTLSDHRSRNCSSNEREDRCVHWLAVVLVDHNWSSQILKESSKNSVPGRSCDPQGSGFYNR